MRVFFVVILSLVCGWSMAGEATKNVAFKLDQWVQLEVTDGPVTIHRFRIEEQGGGLTKSKIFRPGNSENLQQVQIQIEYSNSSSRDWEADLDIGWYDGKGRLIDGYRDDEKIDEDESHELMTITLSTLKYGLDVAKTLKFKIEFEAD